MNMWVTQVNIKDLFEPVLHFKKKKHIVQIKCDQAN